MKNKGARGAQCARGARGEKPSSTYLEHIEHLEHLEHLWVFLLLALALASPIAAQGDPRPNECWGFAFGSWTPALDWRAAGHTAYAQRGAPPRPEASTTDGAPRHDAASFTRTGGPALILYPTWWPVGVGIALERQPAAGDTVSGVAYAFVADGRSIPPESRIRAWRTACGAPVDPGPTRAEPDERRSPPARPAVEQPRRSRAGRPR